jgi:AcrR family transcriptional regulator
MNHSPQTGLRARKKIATEEALREAALRLFAERGYRATTIADIAAGANVSERTFFRYFASKDDVALQDIVRLMPVFQQAIHQRPPAEAPLQALRRAFTAVIEDTDAPRLALLYSGPPISWATPPTQSGVRILTMLEAAVAEALLSRPPVDPAEPADERRFRTVIAARAGFAAIRSAFIRFHELGGAETLPVARFLDLVGQAFTLLENGCQTPAHSSGADRGGSDRDSGGNSGSGGRDSDGGGSGGGGSGGGGSSSSSSSEVDDE